MKLKTTLNHPKNHRGKQALEGFFSYQSYKEREAFEVTN